MKFKCKRIIFVESFGKFESNTKNHIMNIEDIFDFNEKLVVTIMGAETTFFKLKTLQNPSQVYNLVNNKN